MRTAVVIVTLGTAGLVWIGVSAQQEMLPKPGPGSGLTKVVGTVTISNTPDVRVVEMPQMPPTAIAAPPFLRKGGKYAITWTDGATDTVTVLDAGQDGWIQVEGTRWRWVNLRAARGVEESR